MRHRLFFCIPKSLRSYLSLVLLVLLLAACASDNSSSSSDSASAPAAPTELTATSGNVKIILTWNVMAGATTYKVYLAEQSGVTKSNYAGLTGGMQVTASSNSYTVSDLTDGATYYIVVMAVNENGESAESTETSAMPYVWKSVASGYHHVLALRNDNTSQSALLLISIASLGSFYPHFGL